MKEDFKLVTMLNEIRVFIPKELRKLAECHDMDRCPQFSNKDCLNFKKEYERDREKESSH